MVFKVWQDFHEAAVNGASAIAAGHVPPINPTEATRQHVYVFNNMFFSFAVDSKDAYKVLGGDKAASKSARHDLRNVQLLDYFQLSHGVGVKAQEVPTDPAEAAAAAEAAATGQTIASTGERLCTLATALIDLPCAGRRLVAQSIIPGILQGDQLSKVIIKKTFYKTGGRRSKL